MEGQTAQTERMRVLFCAGREASYVRNRMVLRALARNFQVGILTGERPASLTMRCARVLARLPGELRKDWQLVWVGFYGHPLVPAVRKLFSGPIIFDAYLSNYDTLCLDRKRFSPHSPLGRLAWNLDRWASLAANVVTLDTKTQAKYFLETFGLEEGKVCHFYLGAEEDIFWPRSPPKAEDPFRVLYYGSFQPLHGMEFVLRAAKLVGPGVEFKILGRGAEYPRMKRLAESLELDNVSFHSPIPYRDLPGEIAKASVCLGGPFGTSPKAQRVITSKTYQALAMAKPVVVGDTPANREILTPRREAMMVPVGDAEALTEAILELKREHNLREELAENGYQLFRSSFTLERISRRVQELVGKVL